MKGGCAFPAIFCAKGMKFRIVLMVFRKEISRYIGFISSEGGQVKATPDLEEFTSQPYSPMGLMPRGSERP